MAALDGIFVDVQLPASSSAPGLKCMQSLVADICTVHQHPWANRVDLTTDFKLSIQWKGDFGISRGLPMAWLRGGEILVSRVFPISWSGALTGGGRILPIAWSIPFIDVDRKLSIAWQNAFAVDRILAVALPSGR